MPFFRSAARASAALILISATLLGSVAASAATCTGDDFAKAVDEAGAALRQYNLEAAPKMHAKFRALAAKKGWSEAEADEQAVATLRDERTAKLDETANTLLAKIDTLGRQDPAKPADCARLDELRTAGIELMAVMKAKTSYLTTRVDSEMTPEPAPAARPGQEASAAPAKQDPPKSADVPAPPPPALKPTVPAAAVKERAPWSATTAATKQPSPPAAAQVTAPPLATKSETEVAMLPPPPSPPVESSGGPRPTAPLNPPPPQVFAPDDGYTIDDIRDATRGFFGTISTELAAVIEHVFAEIGRPTGYVLGQEGGGAFLGGLRYGDGTLYARAGGTRKIYWHGPSVGFDVGAAGTRTMFLIYKMREPEDLYRAFTGIDGSAFVVGGVGLTLLGGGGMTLAPIRSGLGVRLGANIGYVRFTPTQTWNPF